MGGVCGEEVMLRKEEWEWREELNGRTQLVDASGVVGKHRLPGPATRDIGWRELHVDGTRI